MRLFVALGFTEPGLDALVELSSLFGSDNPGLRRVPRENLHLTLRFYGEAAPEDVERTVEEEIARKDFGPLNYRLDRLGTFGGRVLWVGGEVSPGVGDLAKALGNRSFRPHVTLARGSVGRGPVKEPPFPPVIGGFNGIVLYESVLTPGGPVYHRVNRWLQGLP